MENVFAADFDETQDKPGYRWQRIRLARRLGGEMLGASVFVLPPGEKSFPYHIHRANEELLLVLEGTVELRRPEGTEEMTTGDAALFRRGEAGAHQVINTSDSPARSSCSQRWCTRRSLSIPTAGTSASSTPTVAKPAAWFGSWTGRPSGTISKAAELRLDRSDPAQCGP